MNWIVVYHIIGYVVLVTAYALLKKALTLLMSDQDRQEFTAHISQRIWKYTTFLEGNAVTVHAPSFERNESAVVLSESLCCQYYTLAHLITGNHPSTLDYAVLAYLCGDAKSIWFFEDGRCEPLPRFRSVWPLFHNSPPWSPQINSISSSLRHITRPSQPKWIALFPEVNQTEPLLLELHKASCYSMGVHVFKNLLYPRFSSFVDSVTHLRNEGYTVMYDLTLDYYRLATDGSRKHVAPTMIDIVMSPPRTWHVVVTMRRVTLADLPGTRPGLERWLEHCWKIKDKALSRSKI